jgi:tetratricopeptide (TPR) repeat protein
MAKYKCHTLGDCDRANAGEVFERSPGEDLHCPGCATPLEPVVTAQPDGTGNKKMIPVVAGVVVLALLAGGGYLYSKRAPVPAVAVDPAPTVAAAVVPVPVAAPVPALATVPASPAGMAPSDVETRALRLEGEAQLAGGDAQNAANASSRAAVNELLKVAIAHMAQGKLADADKDLAQARERGPKEPLVYYNMAILRLKQGRTDDAMKEFEASFMAGFNHFDKLAEDHDLDDLRKTPQFAALLKQYDSKAR